MMKWFVLFVCMGCFGCAAGFIDKSDIDDDWDEEVDDNDEMTHLKSVNADTEPEKYTTKERIYWAIGGIIALIIFFTL